MKTVQVAALHLTRRTAETSERTATEEWPDGKQRRGGVGCHCWRRTVIGPWNSSHGAKPDCARGRLSDQGVAMISQLN